MLGKGREGDRPLDEGGRRLVHAVSVDAYVLRQIAVLVPTAVKELHERHARFGQPPRKDAVRGERSFLPTTRSARIENAPILACLFNLDPQIRTISLSRQSGESNRRLRSDVISPACSRMRSTVIFFGRRSKSIFCWTSLITDIRIGRVQSLHSISVRTPPFRRSNR
jgi:hypothetical protein